MILVTGGARSGKSRFAESHVNGKVLYIATAVATDAEMRERIEIHKASRPKNWDTYEGFLDLSEIISSNGNNYDFILLECITTLITNLLFHFGGFDAEKINYTKVEAQIIAQIDEILKQSKSTKAEVLFITNEIGLGIVPADALSRNFRDIQGRANQKIASICDEVYMIMSGLPLRLK